MLKRSLALCLVALKATVVLAQGSIAGTVYDSLSTHAPLANATVVLIERSRYATTDARGRFRIDSVPAGHFSLSFIDPELDSLGLEAPVTPVDVTAGKRVDVKLFAPSPVTAYALPCARSGWRTSLTRKQ